MDETNTNQHWSYTQSSEFNGIPCVVYQETHIILHKGDKTTADFVESEEFQMLENAGIEVHSGAYS